LRQLEHHIFGKTHWQTQNINKKAWHLQAVSNTYSLCRVSIVSI